MAKTKEQLAELRLIAISLLSGIMNADPLQAYKAQRYKDAIAMAKEFQDVMDKEIVS